MGEKDAAHFSNSPSPSKEYTHTHTKEIAQEEILDPPLAFKALMNIDLCLANIKPLSAQTREHHLAMKAILYSIMSII